MKKRIDIIRADIQKTENALELSHDIQCVKKIKWLCEEINKNIKPLSFYEKYFKFGKVRKTEKLSIKTLIQKSKITLNYIFIDDIINEYQLINFKNRYNKYKSCDRINEIRKLYRYLKTRFDSDKYELSEKQIDDIYSGVFKPEF